MVVIGRIVGMTVQSPGEIFFHAVGMTGRLERLCMDLECLEG
jgi:hypothetical protein